MWQVCQDEVRRYKICDERFYSYWVPSCRDGFSRIGFDRERVARGKSSGTTFGYREAGLSAEVPLWLGTLTTSQLKNIVSLS